MTDTVLVYRILRTAAEAEGRRAESVLLWPDHLAPERVRLSRLRRTYEQLHAQCEARGLGPRVRALQSSVFSD